MSKKNSRSKPYPPQNPRKSLRQVILTSRQEAETNQNDSEQAESAMTVNIISNDTTDPGQTTRRGRPARASTSTDTGRSQPGNSQTGNSTGPTMSQFHELQNNVMGITNVLQSMQVSLDKISKEQNSNSVSHEIESNFNRVHNENGVDVIQNQPGGSHDVVVNKNTSHVQLPIDVFNVNYQPIDVDCVVQGAVDENLEGLVEDNVTHVQPGNFKQIGRPVDLKIPDTIKQKIWADQYVELEKLIEIPTPKTPSGLELVGMKLVPIKPLKQFPFL